MTSSDWPITDDAIRDVFDTMLSDGSWGRYHGPHCDALRTALAEYHQTEHIVLCSSGTSAVELALRGVGVSSGDEVILAAYDYKANFANVLMVGATPVLVDTLPGVPVLDPAQLAAACTDRTKAVVCSHLHGSLAPMPGVTAIAEERGIHVIEDACQAPGAVLHGQRAGSIGDVGVLSFGGSKLLTAGRGGAVLTSNATLAQRIRLYTQRGNDAYPLSEMQAAVLLPQLRQLDDRNAIRLANVRHLLEQLADVDRLQLAVDPDPRTTVDTPAFYKLAFRDVVESSPAASRDNLAAQLREHRLPIDPGFPALHLVHSRRRFRATGDLPNATALHSQLLTMHHPVLLSSDRTAGLASKFRAACRLSPAEQ